MATKAYNKNPSEMFTRCAVKNKNQAAIEYAEYINAKEIGDTVTAKKHYLIYKQYNDLAKKNREAAKEYEGKTWKDLKNPT